jgi:hypothetical protein
MVFCGALANLLFECPGLGIGAEAAEITLIVNMQRNRLNSSQVRTNGPDSRAEAGAFNDFD